MANRIAVLGGLIAGLGFFFLPLIELKPNRLAPGISFELLELEGDLRYLVLFLLAVVPIVVALRRLDSSRGWLLAGLGNLLLLLTLLLPAQAGVQLIENAQSLLGENVLLSNPRILPSAALATGLLGGYVTLYAGLRDLARTGVPRAARLVLSWGGVALIVLLTVVGSFDIYSVLVEFEARGEQLGRRALEHVMFVGVALAIGLVLGIGLGLWSHRDERMSPVLLYAVGIIQTIPSLALFGLLLVPLARLGDQLVWRLALVFLAALAVAALLAGAYRMLAPRIGATARQLLLVVAAISVTVPLALLTVVVASFLFRTGLIAFGSAGGPFPALRTVMLLGLVAGLALWALAPSLRGASGRIARYGSWAGYAALAVALLWALGEASAIYLARVESAGQLTVRELGVSGIGPAPAVIALTLYSLLPLVRNTHAGLANVDPAIIDSGRGMGMNAGQRFLQIELPIALPVIVAGVRNAAVALVGIGAVATVIGAGGLGDFILSGIINTSIDQILLGAVPAVLLAAALDAVLRGMERLLVSPGIREAGD